MAIKETTPKTILEIENTDILMDIFYQNQENALLAGRPMKRKIFEGYINWKIQQFEAESQHTHRNLAQANLFRAAVGSEHNMLNLCEIQAMKAEDLLHSAQTVTEANSATAKLAGWQAQFNLITQKP